MYVCKQILHIKSHRWLAAVFLAKIDTESIFEVKGKAMNSQQHDSLEM